MPLLTFAIESSCDETSASILRDNDILSNVISSQHFHSAYGGIVPELASRAHTEVIDEITSEAFSQANVSKQEIDLVSATAGPGLIGSLLVGYNYARAFAISRKLKFIGINHIESHLYSCFIGQEEIEFPFIALIVSGGHTLLVHVKDYFNYRILGTTQDDAAGEAFDKVAKLMGLGYPGGPEIDRLAKEGNNKFHEFPLANVKENIYDFSFSGIKTSVLYFLRKNYSNSKKEIDLKKIPLNDVSASFQKAVVSSLAGKTSLSARQFKVKHIAVSGGVSANSKLKEEFRKLEPKGFIIHFPELKYSTDNAAMIGFTAYLKHKHSGISQNNWKEHLFKPAFARLDYENF
jgi:tRNA N6-adenosine threonylcarbamoyltransferase